MSVIKEVLALRSQICKQRASGERQYKVVNSFAETTAESEGMIEQFFRRFQPVKEERYRRTNIEAGFDIHTHSLMDYPSIIQYKVGGCWTSYNMLIAVHVPLCPYNCWHCYNDKKLHSPENATWVTAKELVEAFCKQRNFDKQRDVQSNVLRITGGEPFLVPDLILECLQELKRQLPSDKVFLWTETDLLPFIPENGKSFVEQFTIEEQGVTLKVLEELAKYPNLAVHPCLHGLDDENIAEVTLRRDVTLAQLLEGLKILLKYGIDIYPTFGSNVSPPHDIVRLFEELYELDKYLPLRFALVQYALDYPEVEERLMEQQKSRECKLYSKYTSLRIWNSLLMKHYNIGYAVIPRHLITLGGGANPIMASSEFMPSEEYEPKDELIYLFKSSYREDYHRELLDMLALPKGHVYRLEYDVEWVQDDLWQHMKMRPENYRDREALLLYLDLEAPGKQVIPLRRLMIRKVDVRGKVLVLHFQLGNFTHPPYRKPDLLKDLRSKLEPLFGKHTMGGTPLNKLVLLGEKIPELQQVEEDNDLSDWKQAIDLLHENNCVKFEKSLFYKVRIDGATPIVEDSENPRTVYEVKGGKKVSIQVDYYLPNYGRFPGSDVEARAIIYESSSELIEALGPKQFILSKYGSDRLIFSTAEVRDTQTCIIHFQSPRTPFEAPMLDVAIRISGSGTKIGTTRAASVVLSGLGGGVLATFVSLLAAGYLNLWSGLLILLPGVTLLFVGGFLSTKYTRI